MSSLTRLIGAACVVATIALLATAAVGSAATSLTGKDVAKAFNTCRKEKGVSGRCTRRVLRYSCLDTGCR